jgi:CubicO group peptidase (beta-lactamase class C family)
MSMGELPPAPFTVADPWVDVDVDGDLENLSGEPQTWVATLTHPVLYSTAQDMAKWMHALYHERRVLSEQSLREMLAIPEVTVRDPEGGKYGLGMVDFSEILETNAIGHMGSSLGYTAAALYLPERGISLAWCMNTGQSPSGLAEGLMWDTWSRLSRVLFEHTNAERQGLLLDDGRKDETRT